MVLLNAGGQGYSVSIILGIDPGSRVPAMARCRGRQTTDYLGGGYSRKSR